MKLNDLLIKERIDPRRVLVLRHRPQERALNKVLPWLAAEKPDVFNAYQQTQGEKLQKVMESMAGHGHVASFIGHEPTKALFIGLYSIGNYRRLSVQQYWQIPAYREMKAFGMKGFNEATPQGRNSILWFDLAMTDFYASWKGKLIVNWPPPERSWWRRSHRNEITICAVLENSALYKEMPKWYEISFEWKELGILPNHWKSALSQWRGVYFVFDASAGKGYVGSASGAENIYGRWLNYAARGHGGNRLLRKRNPQNFRFSILQRVSPDMDVKELVAIENSWKERLHTREPFGLNDN